MDTHLHTFREISGRYNLPERYFTDTENMILKRLIFSLILSEKGIFPKTGLEKGGSSYIQGRLIFGSIRYEFRTQTEPLKTHGPEMPELLYDLIQIV